MRANRALIVSQGTDCFNQIQNALLDVGQARQPGLSMRFRLRKMTRMADLHGPPMSDNEPIRLCRRKAMSTSAPR